jgi:hypothetical protein
MRRYLTLPIAALVTSAVLGALVGTASAGRLNTSSQTFRVTWSALEFSGFEGAAIRCAVTLEGSFSSTNITKVMRSNIGLVTGARIARPCTNGTGWFSNGTEVNEVLGGTFTQTLPWPVTYEGFGGNLPAISSVRLLFSNMAFTLRGTWLLVQTLCQFRTGTNGNATGTATRNMTDGEINRLVASGRISPTTAGCPEVTLVSGAADGNISVFNAATRITIRLI